MKPNPRIVSSPADFSSPANPPQFVRPIPEEHIYRVMEGDMRVPLVVQRALEDEEQREQSTPLSRMEKIEVAVVMALALVPWIGVLLAWRMPDHFAAWLSVLS